MSKKTTCAICQKIIAEHELKHIFANKYVDIPISQFIFCSKCKKKESI